jgi:Na+/melibiose symporter-like transporter
MTLGGFLFLNTLYLQDIRGDSPLHAGLLTIPMAAASAACAMISGRLVAARGPRPALVLAGLLLTAGTGLLTGTGRETGTWYLVLAYLLFGTGFGLVGTPVTSGQAPASSRKGHSCSAASVLTGIAGRP